MLSLDETKTDRHLRDDLKSEHQMLKEEITKVDMSSGMERYRCKLSEIPISRPIIGQEACKPGKPALLPIEKLKLHYVVHYMLRGTWSDIVPEEQDESRVEAYKCNLCQKKFKNNYEKKEFPARGSIICHIATEHGRLIEALTNDEKVDMSEDILLLSTMINGRTSKPVESDSKSNDKELVTIIESELWRNDKKQKTRSLKVSSTTSINESTIDNSSTNDENKSTQSGLDSNDNKDTILTTANLKVTSGIEPKNFYSKVYL